MQEKIVLSWQKKELKFGYKAATVSNEKTHAIGKRVRCLSSKGETKNQNICKRCKRCKAPFLVNVQVHKFHKFCTQCKTKKYMY